MNYFEMIQPAATPLPRESLIKDVCKTIRNKHRLDNYNERCFIRSNNQKQIMQNLFELVKELGFIIESSQDRSLSSFSGILFDESPDPTRPDDVVPVCWVSAWMGNDVIIEMEGEPAFIKQHMTRLRDEYPQNSKAIFIASYNKANENVTAFAEQIHPTDKNQPRDVFYPQIIGETLDDYWQAYLESKASLLLLIGPPGTGKTTWLRGLALKPELKVLVCDDPIAIETGAIFRHYQRTDFNLLIVEEADRYLLPREDGNSMMGGLLNAADGIVKHENKKIIISTNLSSVNKVDQALLRVGRCFDVLKFDYLTPQQAYEIEVHEGLNHQDFGSSSNITLSKVLNPESRLTMNRYGRPIGF